jgi:hypothetical protein
MRIRGHKHSRREALALAGMGLLAPLVRQHRLMAAGATVPRFIFIHNQMGFALGSAGTKNKSIDSVEASDFTLTGMFEPLNAIKSKLLLLENVTGKWYRTGGGHHTNSLLTGWAPSSESAAPQSQSIDYFIDNYLRAKLGPRMFGYLQSPAGQGMNLSLGQYFQPMGFGFSFTEGGQSLQQEIVPNNLYKKMAAAAGTVVTPKPTEDPQDAARRAVYDYLLKELQSFKTRGKLGADEAAKLESQIAGLTGAPASGSVGSSTPAGSLPNTETLPNQIADSAYKHCMEWAALEQDKTLFRRAQQNHFALLRMAVQYGFAHVGLMNTGGDHGEINNGTVTRLVVSEALDNIKAQVDKARANGVVDSHNMVSHYDLGEGPDGYLSSQAWGGQVGDPSYAKRAHRAMQTNVIGRVAQFAQQLDSVMEPNGATALDNTLIFFFSDMADGNHQVEGLKYVLIGGKSLGVRQGRYLTYPSGDHGSVLQEPDILREVVNIAIRATGGPASDLKAIWGNPANNNKSFDPRIRA